MFRAKQLNAPTHRTAFGLAVLLVSMMIVPPLALAQQQGPLAFEDGRPLTLTWEQVASGTVSVTVCNVGSPDLEVASLRAVLTGFRFKVSQQEVPVAAVLGSPLVFQLESPDPGATLLAGGCASLPIGPPADNASTPDPGSYAGLLSVSGKEAGLISREVTVAGPKATTQPVKASAVGEMAVTATLTGEAIKLALPFKAPGALASLKLPEVGIRIGVVYANGHLGTVHVDGIPEEPQDGILLLPARIEGLDLPGSYKGTVNLTGVDDDEVALTLTLTEGSKPLAAKVSATGIRNPWTRSVRFKDGLRVPFHVPKDSPGPELYPAGSYVGAVSGAEQIRDVRLCTEQPEAAGELQAVCLEVSGLAKPGKYTGLVDVTDNELDIDGIELSLTVRDALIWAILASAAGILIAALVMWLGQGLRPWLGMKARAAKLERKDEGQVPMCEGAQQHPYLVSATADLADFREGYDTYKRRLMWNTASEEYLGLVKALDAVDTAYQLFCKKVGPEWARLRARLDQFEAFLDKQPLAKYTDEPFPVLAAVVTAHVAPPEGKRVIPAAKLQERLDAWKGLIDLMDRWTSMAAAVYRYDRWIEQLRQLSLPGEDRAELHFLEGRLREAVHEMFEAVSSASLVAAQTGQELGAVYQALARLSGKYEAQYADQGVKLWVKPVAPDGIPVRALEAWVDWGDRLRKMVEAMVDKVLGEPEAPARIKRLIGARWTLDIILLLFALAIAVFTGLQADYFDKAFGTGTDYAKFLLLGGGAQALVAGLATIAERLWQRQ